jgi:ABC-type sugar transport system ATPase subunit
LRFPVYVRNDSNNGSNLQVETVRDEARSVNGATASADRPVLSATGVVKRYGAVVALGGADIELRRGEVMALLGDNGAGKSTLIKILVGALQADEGSIRIGDRDVSSHSLSTARQLGIEAVYQDLALVEPMTAMHNIFLGREEVYDNLLGRLLALTNDRSMRVRAREVLDRMKVNLPSVDAQVQNLSGGQRQALAIARAVLWGKQLVVLDEPTAALGVKESGQVLEIVGRLRDEGTSVILITHNMDHVWRVADRATVLRHGKTAGVRTIKETTPEEIVALITGAAALTAAGAAHA